jgi:hypothetical protein
MLDYQPSGRVRLRRREVVPGDRGLASGYRTTSTSLRSLGFGYSSAAPRRTSSTYSICVGALAPRLRRMTRALPNPRRQLKSAFSRFPAVHRAYLEGQQRDETGPTDRVFDWKARASLICRCLRPARVPGVARPSLEFRSRHFVVAKIRRRCYIGQWSGQSRPARAGGTEASVWVKRSPRLRHFAHSLRQESIFLISVFRNPLKSLDSEK